MIAGLSSTVPVIAGITYEVARKRLDDVRWPGFGERIDLDGSRTHIRRMGTGNPAPTVVFESGMATPLEMWDRVQRAVAEVAPTISYDRPGIGRSDAIARPRTAALAGDRLVRLLEVLDVAGPLILVGHSYGGLLLRDFAQRHADRVAGVVLVDPTHPEQLERSPRQRAGAETARAAISDSTLAASVGWLRLRGLDLGEECSGLGDAQRSTVVARMTSTSHWRATAQERDAWVNHVADEVRHTVLPPAAPVFVLTAGRTAEQDPVQTDLHAELAAQSSAGVHQVVPGASHLGLLCSPEQARVTAAAVLEVLDAGQNGTRAEARRHRRRP